MEMFTDNFCRFVRNLSLKLHQDLPPEFDYNSSVLILIDAVLSMNRHYNLFVVPRIEIIKKSDVQTLEGLKVKIKNDGIKNFCKFWNYNHPERVKILERLVDKFLEIKKELKVKEDIKALHKWGRQSTVDNFKEFNVKGIGFATFQHLRLMCGADTTKPDVHLKRAVEEGTGKRLSELETVRVVEEAAKRLNISTRKLDHALWNYYSRKANKRKMEFLY